MISDKIIIAGTGCALVDYLYTKVRFNSQAFLRYSSKQEGDGGLAPGKLVFTDELEKFANEGYFEIIYEVSERKSFDKFNIGGPGLVSLIHASQMLLTTEFEVCFFGITGNDDIAEALFNFLKITPLNISNYLRNSEKPTPFTHVFSDSTFDSGNGERTFVNNIGAAWDFVPEMLTENFFNAHIVCFGGTALVPQLHDHLTAQLRKAKKNNCITIVNTVFDFRNEKKNPGKPWPLGETDESYTLIDILLMDGEEALKLSGKSMLEDAAVYFRDKQVSSFLITNGIKEVFAYSSGQFFNKLAISRFPVSQNILNELQSDLNKKGDTTGCGDNFAGGVIASVAQQLKFTKTGNFDLIEALSWGVSSGGFACFYAGGAYFEQRQGEKLEKIAAYQKEYLQQIENRRI